MCGLDVYGPFPALFAADCPFDPDKGPGSIRDTNAILEGLELSAGNRAKICEGNAEALLHLRAG